MQFLFLDVFLTICFFNEFRRVGLRIFLLILAQDSLNCIGKLFS